MTHANSPNLTQETNASLLANTKNTSRPWVIGIVAGEASGDSLGADFMRQMTQRFPHIHWVGVGGENMRNQGLQPLFDLSRLAVMGLVEVVSHLPDLLKARKELCEEFAKQKIDAFIGIDAPDFNLRVAKRLKPKGIFCVQYVSPSVWAWRESRIHAIKQATHLVLCLFPFELPVYQRHHHPAVCVGHPLLHSIDQHLLNKPKLYLRAKFDWQPPTSTSPKNLSQVLTGIGQLICVMPGSRMSEINAMMPTMLDAVAKLTKRDRQLRFIIPTVMATHQNAIQQMIDFQHPSLNECVVVICHNSKPNLSQWAMAISDLILLASGTATLEAMLLTRPMVVIYRLNQLTYQIAKRLVKLPYVSLPNILAVNQTSDPTQNQANKTNQTRLKTRPHRTHLPKQQSTAPTSLPIVPELIQQQANADNICQTVQAQLQRKPYQQQIQALQHTSRVLREQSHQSAAEVVAEHLLARL